MKKIVINSCFGDFGLSPKAIERYAELQGRKCYWFKGGLENASGTKYTPMIPTGKEMFGFIAFDIPNPNEVFADKKPWHEMSLEEKKEQNALYTNLYTKHSFYNSSISRDDPLLVQVVEELGSKEASSWAAELTVVEIPDDVEWEISKYDGSERVCEKHRSWA